MGSAGKFKNFICPFAIMSRLYGFDGAPDPIHDCTCWLKAQNYMKTTGNQNLSSNFTVCKNEYRYQECRIYMEIPEI